MRPAGQDEAAPAKINLTLHVAAPRPDGLHPLRSLVVFAPGAADQVAARPARGLTLEITGPGAAGLATGPDNLVMRAALALAEAAGISADADMTLHKMLPVASGIGGGSADAAAALRALNRLWRLDWPQAALEQVAAGLGSDVAACVACQPVWMSGTGSELAPAPPLPPLEAVLVNPGVPCPTGPVYGALDQSGRFGALEHAPLPDGGFADRSAVLAWLAGCRNDLEPAAAALVPQTGPLLAGLRAVPGVALARLSGSGATCWAIVDAAAGEAAERAAVLVGPDGWVCHTPLGAGL
jgi:4-diphosphocytidyl-2-C-methyl-D-erythritol kinase